jgi:hypothetical protein
MLRTGKLTGFDGVAIGRHACHGICFQVFELSNEFGHVAVVETQQVMENQDLAVAVGAGPDADGGDGQGRGDLPAMSAGMPSSTTEKAPAASTLCASASSRSSSR